MHYIDNLLMHYTAQKDEQIVWVQNVLLAVQQSGLYIKYTRQH